MSYKFSFFGLSDCGLVRKNNEDVFTIASELPFAALADGMGGHKAGEVAAELACYYLLEAVEKGRCFAQENVGTESVESVLAFELEDVNRRVYEYSLDHQDYEGMGTTLCCVYFEEGKVVYGHIGDSRVYRYRNGELTQITHDHSLVNRLIGRGEMEEGDAKYRAQRNVLTRAIGLRAEVEVEVAAEEVQEGDYYLLCSDGLSDYVSHDQIADLIESGKSLEGVAHLLVDAANMSGGHDNTTVVVVQVERG